MAVDYNDLINRVIEILKKNTNIWTDPHVKGKLRSITLGEEDGLIYDGATPYVRVTTPNKPFLTKEQFGVGDNATDPQNSIQLLVKVIVQKSDSESTERELYTFVKEIMNSLQSNKRLQDPVALNDPKCIRSFIF